MTDRLTDEELERLAAISSMFREFVLETTTTELLFNIAEGPQTYRSAGKTNCCKNCRHWSESDYSCPHLVTFTWPDFHCSHFERKEHD